MFFVFKANPHDHICFSPSKPGVFVMITFPLLHTGLPESFGALHAPGSGLCPCSSLISMVFPDIVTWLSLHFLWAILKDHIIGGLHSPSSLNNTSNHNSIARSNTGHLAMLEFQVNRSNIFV